MAKKAGKNMGYASKTVGNSVDGARPSAKKQSTALLPKNKIGSALKGRTARMAKMEKLDPSC